MTVDTSSTNMIQLMQNSDAITKLSLAKDIAPSVSSESTGVSMAADPTGEALQALTYAIEGQVVSIQSALADSLVSISV